MTIPAFFASIYDHYRAKADPVCTEDAGLRETYRASADIVALRMMRAARKEIEDGNRG